MATQTRTWNDSDDAAYWAEQARRDAEPADPRLTLIALERQYSNIAGMRDPAVVASLPAMRERIAALKARVAEIDGLADAKAAFAAEWTREVTIERRARWNAAVKSGRYNIGRTRNIHVVNLTHDMGFGVADIERAIALHNL